LSSTDVLDDVTEVEASDHAPGARRSVVPLVARVVSHAAVWIAILVPMIIVSARGWIASGDDAAIAARALHSLSLHPPLLGLASSASYGLGHVVYDPGPLLFWLLAVPVHIDPAHGALWGAAVLGAAVLSVAIEALWARGAWIGGVVVSLVIVDIAWAAPQVFENLMWNAYFPIPFLVAALAFAWLVATGSYGWWPALVFVGSVAAQCHLIYAVPAAGLVIVAPIFAVVSFPRPAHNRWFFGGLLVGLVCWIGPLLQELGPAGNFTALATASNGRATLGVGYGLRALARAGSLHPIWSIHQPTTGLDAIALATNSSPVVGALVLVVMGALGYVTLRRGLRNAAALTFLVLLWALSLIVTFAIFPHSSIQDLLYLSVLFWVVGAALWVAAIWDLVAIVRDVREHSARRPMTGGVEPGGGRPPEPNQLSPIDGAPRPRPRPSTLVGASLVVAVLVLLTIGLSEDSGFRPSLFLQEWSPSMAARIQHGVSVVESEVPRGPVLVSLRPKPKGNAVFVGIWADEGIAWQLEADGWKPGLFGVEAAYTGLQVPINSSVYCAQLTYRGTTVTSARIGHAHIQRSGPSASLECTSAVTRTPGRRGTA
jgi:hypothetical protein